MSTIGARLAVAVAAVVALAGCGGSTIDGNGIASSQSRMLAPFESIELAGSNVVSVHVGGRQSVVVRADRNLVDRVTTVVRDGRLVISNKPGSFASSTPMSVEVTVPSLTALRLSGSGNVLAEGVNASHLTVALPRSGNLGASGRAGSVDVSIAGSGNAQLGRLTARNVRAEVGGSGTIAVHATRSLDASIPGSGSIFYTGNPRLTTTITGSGVVLPGAPPE